MQVSHQQSFILEPGRCNAIANLFGDVFIGCDAAEVYEVLEDGVDFAAWPQGGQLRQLDVAHQNAGHQGRHTIFERLQLHVIRSLGPRLVGRNQFGVVRIHRCWILRRRHKVGSSRERFRSAWDRRRLDRRGDFQFLLHSLRTVMAKYAQDRIDMIGKVGK